MKKISIAIAASLLLGACSSKANTETQEAAETDSTDVATVYFIRDINPDNIIKIYEALGRKADGENVAVKISTGESNKSNHLDADLIAPFVKLVNGTIVECNTAYEGNRNGTEKHLKAAEEHGFTKIAKVDIMDAEGDTILPISGGRHLEYDIVGKSYPDYDFTVVLSHFKGHPMGGFGGALKNISIGIGSSVGKTYIHTGGKSKDVATIWQNTCSQTDFLESMGEAAKAIVDHCGDKILYINVANKLSVDCDCVADPEPVKMGDLGIFASLDPVALDRACVDAVFNSEDPGKADLIERINSRKATHLLDYSEELGLGTQKYKLVEIK